MRKGLLLILFFYSTHAIAQTFDDWAKLVKWDGITPWRQYLVFSSGFMGPNALPVPEIGNGTVDSINHVSASGVFHFSKGDHTQNVKLSGNYCLVKDFISADITWIPIEWFRQSAQIKDERHVYYDGYYDHKAPGDVYLNVNVQLLNRWRRDIHLVFRTGFRYPTSSSVGAARYTDAPGYHFDLSGGIPLSNKFKLTTMAGFYVWQLNTKGQNDAILFGGGFEYNHKGWRWQTNCRGYSGYLNNGDRPVIAGSLLEKKSKNISVLFGLHQGLHAYKYTSIELGAKYSFAKKGRSKQLQSSEAGGRN